MAAISVSQLLTLYTWFPLAVLLVFLLFIARFYQKSSSEITYYRLYIVPIIFFGASTVRYASINQLAGDVLGDLLMGTGGLFLVLLSVYLLHLMTRNR